MKESIPEAVNGSVFDIDDYQDRRVEYQKRKRTNRVVGAVALREALETRPQRDLRKLEAQVFHKAELGMLLEMSRVKTRFQEDQATDIEVLQAVEDVVAKYMKSSVEDSDSNIKPIGVMKYSSHPAPEIPQEPSGRDRVIPIDRQIKNHS